MTARPNLAFRVSRKGTTLGEHHVAFTRTDGMLTAETTLDLTVKLAFITIYRLTLRARETWSDGALIAARVDSTANGRTSFVAAERTGDTLTVQGTGAPRYTAPPGAVIACHWNRGQLGVPLINPQTGALLDIAVTPRGPARLKDAAGAARDAERFALTGAYTIDLWYATDGTWMALQAAVPDGSSVIYSPIA